MSEETRVILEKLDFISGGMQTMQNDIGEMKQDIGMLKTDVDNLKNSVGSLENAVVQMNDRVALVESKVYTLHLLVENETNRKIDIIGEGHDFLMKHYHKAEGELRAKEKMELDILGLKADMRAVKLKVGIA